MNKTINLTDWFWSEVKIIEKKKYDRSQEREITSYSIGREICQCATETFIENSRNPGKMRSIMMICFLIDMLMRRKKYSAGKSGQKIYAKFNNSFRYPIIVAHPMGEEFPSPSWFVCSFFGIDKKVDWGIVSCVSKILLDDLFDWFVVEKVKYKSFEKKMLRIIDSEFKPEPKEYLKAIMKGKMVRSKGTDDNTLEPNAAVATGQYLVAGELIRRGYIPSITLRDSFGKNIIVSNSDGSKAKSVQVKTKRGLDKKWRLVTNMAESSKSENLCYIFVALGGEYERPSYHIVPSKVVDEESITIDNDRLGNRNLGGPERRFRRVNFMDPKDKYLDAWHNLNL